MHQLEPKSPEFPDRLDMLEWLTARNWCPGAESNHRHGDFQSLEVPLRRASFPLGTSIRPLADSAASSKESRTQGAQAAAAQAKCLAILQNERWSLLELELHHMDQVGDG